MWGGDSTGWQGRCQRKRRDGEDREVMGERTTCLCHVIYCDVMCEDNLQCERILLCFLTML